MPTTIRSFPLNLSILLQNENNSWDLVAEGRTLPQKLIEEWIAENATDLDREADTIFARADALLSLPESERIERFEEMEQELVELEAKGSALAARHTAALLLSGHFDLWPQLAEQHAANAVRLGCEPAQYELLKARARLCLPDGVQAFHESCRQTISRDECVLFMAQHLQSRIVDGARVMPSLLDSLLRQARNGSTDALRLLFLAMTYGAFPNGKAAREVYALLLERAKTDVFCARLLAQYKLRLFPVACCDIFGEEDKDGDDEGGGTDSLLHDLEDSADALTDMLLAPLSRIFLHSLELPDRWAQERVHFVHAASLGDPWSELVLHVHDAMWEDCPHDAMEKLRELAEKKNYPPARTFLAVHRINERLGSEAPAEQEDDEGRAFVFTAEELRELSDSLRKSALAMPEDPRLERLWLDFELLYALSWKIMQPDKDAVVEDAVVEDAVVEDAVVEDAVVEDAVVKDAVVEGTIAEEERERFDPDDADAPLLFKVNPQLHFMRNIGTDKVQHWMGRVDYLADVPTSNPHLALIRDRAAANSPYAAFLLGRAILNGAFGDSLKGPKGDLLLGTCLNFAMAHDVEEAIAFAWAHEIADMNGLYDFDDINWNFHYHVARYRSLCHLLLFAQHLDMGKWFLGFLSGKLPDIQDMHLDNVLTPLVSATSLGYELMGMFLMATKFFKVLYLSSLDVGSGTAAPGEDGYEERARTEVIQTLFRTLFTKIITLAMATYDLPTLLLVLAAIHHADQERLDRTAKEELKGLFCLLAENRDIGEPLHRKFERLAGWLQERGVTMDSVRKHFDHFQDARKDNRKRKDRKKQQQRRRAKRKK